MLWFQVEKESEMLNLELQTLQRQSTCNTELISEALRSYEQNSELFQGKLLLMFIFMCEPLASAELWYGKLSLMKQ